MIAKQIELAANQEPELLITGTVLKAIFGVKVLQLVDFLMILVLCIKVTG